MDYQCIVVYTIVRIAPYCSSSSVIFPAAAASAAAAEPSSSSSLLRDDGNGAGELSLPSTSRSRGCLDWVKGQIKR